MVYNDIVHIGFVSVDDVIQQQESINVIICVIKRSIVTC